MLPEAASAEPGVEPDRTVRYSNPSGKICEIDTLAVPEDGEDFNASAAKTGECAASRSTGTRRGVLGGCAGVNCRRSFDDTNFALFAS